MQHLNKKHSIVVFLLVFTVFTVALSGCSEDVPTTTSEEAGLYLFENTVVGLDGKEIVKNGEKVYGLAHNGDIISLSDNTIIVAAYNVEELNCVDECEVSGKEETDSGEISAEIPVVNISATEKAYGESTLNVMLSVKPKDAESRYITVKSGDTRIVCFGEVEESTTAEADKTGTAEIELTAKHKGKVELSVYNAINEKLCSFTVELTETSETNTEKATEILDRVGDCKHKLKDETFASDSGKSKGHTERICTKCGFIEYSDSGDEDVCNHVYETRVIAPTKTSQGFTLHTCTLCGDTYRDHYTAMLKGTGAASAALVTPAPVDTTDPEPEATPKPTKKPNDTTSTSDGPKPTPTPEKNTSSEDTDT